MTTTQNTPNASERRKRRIQFTLGLVCMAASAALIGPLERGIGLWTTAVLLVGIALGAVLTIRTARSAFDRSAKETR